MGTPGVGKSSLATHLASKIQATHIDLGTFAEINGCISGKDLERDTLIVDTKKLSFHIKEVCQSLGGNVVIEGHYAHEVVPKNLVSKVFVLRKNPMILEKVLTEKGFSRKKVMENVVAEILDVCLFDAIKTYGKRKVCEIDVTGKSIETVVNELIDVLDGKKKCSIGVVDWIQELEGEGKIEDYLGWF